MRIFSKEGRALAAEEDAEENFQSIEEYCRWWDVFTEEILPLLPADDLQTFKTICKNWYQIISSPNFVGLHLNIYNQSRIRVLIPRNSEMMIEYNSYYEETKQIHYPPLICSRTSIILGSCDGLLCLLLRGRRWHPTIAVYNPSTGKYSRVRLSPRLENHNYSINCSWFGHHPSSGEYVLVLGIELHKFRYKVGVYKFTRRSNVNPIHSTSCWIEPEVPAPVFLGSCEERGTLFNGAVHWLAKWIDSRDRSRFRYVISAYHLEDNKYLEISPPAQCYCKLGVVEGCLFALFKSDAAAGVFEMWIMKEYGVEQSWTKYAKIEGLDSYRVSPLGFSPNGDLILDVDYIKLIKYNFNDNKAVLLMNHDSGSEAIMCADSLVSPAIFQGE